MIEKYFKNWPTYPLNELLVLNQSGIWGDEGTESDYLVLRSTNIHEGKLITDDVAYRKVSSKEAQKYLLEDGDIIVTKSSGSAQLIGKCCIFTSNGNKKYLFSNFTQRLRVNKDMIDHSFLFYYLTSPFGKAVLARINNTTSGLRNLNMKEYSKQPIPTPPLPIQRKILSILNKCESARAKRKEASRLTDEFLKSVFLDMFGDPAKEKKNIKKLSEACEINPSLDTKLSEDTEVSFIPMRAVSEKGDIDTSQTRRYEDVKNGFTYFKNGDVLFAKITPCMENGKGTIARNLTNGIGYGSTEFHVLRPNKKDVNSEWIYFLLSLDHIRQIAAKNMTGTAGQKRVPVSFLKTFSVSIPPFELQQKFAGIVQKVKKLKEKQRKSEEELNNLFNSLMQKSFKGELQ